MKSILWIGSSYRDLMEMPDAVRRSFGYALYDAQCGNTPVIAKVLRGFGSAGVLELIENDPGGTYRAVYAARFAGAIYVLHCFQKKSTHGIATSQRDLALIAKRLREASARGGSAGERRRPCLKFR